MYGKYPLVWLNLRAAVKKKKLFTKAGTFPKMSVVHNLPSGETINSNHLNWQPGMPQCLIWNAHDNMNFTAKRQSCSFSGIKLKPTRVRVSIFTTNLHRKGLSNPAERRRRCLLSEMKVPSEATPQSCNVFRERPVVQIDWRTASNWNTLKFKQNHWALMHWLQKRGKRGGRRWNLVGCGYRQTTSIGTLDTIWWNWFGGAHQYLRSQNHPAKSSFRWSSIA